MEAVGHEAVVAREAVREQWRHLADRLREIETPLRVLALVGYAGLALLCVVSVTLEGSEHGSHRTPIALAEGVVNVPDLLPPIVAATSLLAWAYVLTGASRFAKRWSIPLLILYAFYTIAIGGATSAASLLILVVVASLATWVVGYVLARRRRPIRPLLLFAILAAQQLAGFAAFWLLRDSDSEAALALNNAAGVVIIVAIPFWLVLSLEATEIGLVSGRWISSLVRQVARGSLLHLVTPVLIVLLALVAALLAGFADLGLVGIDLVFAVALLVAVVVVHARRRQSVPTAVLFQVLGVALFVMALAFAFGLEGSDLVGLPLERLGIFPPVLVFIVLIVYNVVSFGARYVDRDSANMTRHGRVLVYIGVCLLITASTLFLLMRSNGEGGEALDLETKILTRSVTGIGIVAVGLPYVGWLVWRRREEVTGELNANPAPGGATRD